MQSGISASPSLLSQFTTLLSSDTHFALIATIQNEALEPTALLTASSPSSSFSSNLSTLLAPHLSPTTPLYILLRRYPSSVTAPLVAITYVPDTAKVRSKMLFASSRLTLLRELGREHFRETIFATDPKELSAEGFERHDRSVKVEAPLSEQERQLGEVKRAEAEASRGSGEAGRRELGGMTGGVGSVMTAGGGTGKGVGKVAPEVVDALKELGAGARKLVMLKINSDTESIAVEPTSSEPASLSDLTKLISTTEPRFTFYQYSHNHDDGTGSKSYQSLLFIYTCPEVEGRRALKDRMLYPLMKRTVLDTAERDCGLTVVKKLEVESPSEITESAVLEELHPRVEVKKAFSRPKRPGR